LRHARFIGGLERKGNGVGRPPRPRRLGMVQDADTRTRIAWTRPARIVRPPALFRASKTQRPSPSLPRLLLKIFDFRIHRTCVGDLKFRPWLVVQLIIQKSNGKAGGKK
jgi:hypothetical protein